MAVAPTRILCVTKLQIRPPTQLQGPFIRCLEFVDVGSSEYLGHCIREAGMGHQILKPPVTILIPIKPPYRPQGLQALVEQ